jgi:signal transduction histidine kinase
MPTGKKLNRVIHLDMRGENEDARLGKLRPDPAGGLDPLGRLGRGHPDVDDHQVRVLPAHQSEQRSGVAGLPDDVEPGAGEQAGEALPQQDVVVGDDDPGCGWGRSRGRRRLGRGGSHRHAEEYRGSRRPEGSGGTGWLDRLSRVPWPWRVVGCLGCVAVVTAVIDVLRPYVPVLSLGVLYVFAVLVAAVLWGVAYALPVAAASMLAFDWYYLSLGHRMALNEAHNLLTLAVYAVTAVVVSGLAARARQRADFSEQVRDRALEQLQASRARIVAAADDARRRIERDLHDGTQQRLVSLALALRAAQASVPGDLTDLRVELSRVVDGMVEALEDLRKISQGIHPAILAEGGLGPALRALARRSALPVELSGDLGSRFPAEVEVAAYYVVSEALTNAAKHAAASMVQVSVAAAGETLEVTVRDDGVGGADPARGSGLTGLGDRVEALGGRISMTSPPGHGTTIAVTLPIRARGPRAAGVSTRLPAGRPLSR